MRARDLEPLPKIPEPHRGDFIDYGPIRRDQIMLSERLNDLLAILQEFEGSDEEIAAFVERRNLQQRANLAIEAVKAGVLVFNDEKVRKLVLQAAGLA